MSNDLREQLLKAGLVTEQQVQKAKSDKKPPKSASSKKKAASKPHKGKPAKSRPPQAEKNQPTPAKAQPEKSDDIDLAKAYSARAKEERRLKEEQEKAEREARQRRKENREKIRKLILENLQNDDKAEEPYNFQIGQNVKRVYVTATQKKQLAAGELGITFLEGKRCLIPEPIAREILALDAERIVFLADKDDTQGDENDPYKDFQVPDDLTW